MHSIKNTIGQLQLEAAKESLGHRVKQLPVSVFFCSTELFFMLFLMIFFSNVPHFLYFDNKKVL